MSSAGTLEGGTLGVGASVGPVRVVRENPSPGVVPARTSTSKTGAGTGSPARWATMVWKVPVSSRSTPVSEPTPLMTCSLPSVLSTRTSTGP